MNEPGPRFYSVKETANLMGVSEKEIRRLIHSGELKAVFFGKKRSKIRIPGFAIEEYAKEQIILQNANKRR